MSDRASGGALTLYAVNGLHDGASNWLDMLLPAFHKETGIAVSYVEDHSRAIVQRLKDEGPSSRADVLITLPPFIHMAAADGLLEPHRPAIAESIKARDQDPDWRYCPLIKNFPNLIYNTRLVSSPPVFYRDLLAPKFAGKICYSRPGWSGAGTSFLLQILQAFGGKEAGFEYLRALQSNCIQPSAHTAGLAEMIQSGTLLAAIGDVQTNVHQFADNPDMGIVFPAKLNGERYVFEYCYYIALTKASSNADNARKLIDYLLSDAAQGHVSRLAGGLPVRDVAQPDDPSFQRLSALVSGLQIWVPDWATIARTLDDIVAEFEHTVLGVR
jgi:2-aminoethylphosphonate transport system substrate-binding protein